jgi:hypothetical protein
MEIFINELSLKGQFDDINQLETAITRFNEIFTATKAANQLFSTDYKFLLNSKAIKEFLFSQFINRIDKDESLKFKRIVVNQAINWQDEEHKKHSDKDVFFCEVINEFVNNTTIAEAAERRLIDTPSVKRLIVNFIQSDFKTPVCIIKNEEHSIEIDCVETKEAFDKWLDLPVSPLDDFMRNTNRFIRTKFKQQGATVFQEKSTAYYWYIDNLHKDEFEVFNSNKEHIGVANLEGIIQPNSKIKGRVIDF